MRCRAAKEEGIRHGQHIFLTSFGLEEGGGSIIVHVGEANGQLTQGPPQAAKALATTLGMCVINHVCLSPKGRYRFPKFHLPARWCHHIEVTF